MKNNMAEEIKSALKDFTWSYLTVNLDELADSDNFIASVCYLEHKGSRYPIIRYWPTIVPIFSYPDEFHRFVDMNHPYIRGHFYIFCDELIREFDQLDIAGDNYYVIPFEDMQEATDCYNSWPLGFEMAARQHGESLIDFVPKSLKATYDFPKLITTWEAFYNALSDVLNMDYGYIEERKSMIEYFYSLPLVTGAMSQEAIKVAEETFLFDIGNQYQGSECYEVTSTSKIKNIEAISRGE